MLGVVFVSFVAVMVIFVITRQMFLDSLQTYGNSHLHL